jgi:hypothetical protein
MDDLQERVARLRAQTGCTAAQAWRAIHLAILIDAGVQTKETERVLTRIEAWLDQTPARPVM